MRILLTTHVFFPDYSAGTEVLVRDTALELKKRGHQVEICTGHLSQRDLPDSRRFDSYEYMGLRVHRFHHAAVPMGNQTNVVEAEYNNAFFAAWFRGYLESYRPDIVHFFHLGLLSASAIDVGAALKIPMMMTPTDFWLVCPNNQLRLPDNSMCGGPDENSVNCIRHAASNIPVPVLSKTFNILPERIIGWLVKGADKKLFDFNKYGSMARALTHRAVFLRERMNKLERVIAPTRLMAETLENNGLRAEKIIYLPYGIRDVPQVRRAPADKFRIGFIGGISEHKGAHILIEAVKQLPAEIGFELKIYGNLSHYPEYYGRLKQLAAGDSRISFCGTFPNEDIGKVLSEMDVLVVPSIWYENTPLVVYSAQAANCPVIASDIPGIAEVIEHGFNGLLFEPGNPARLAAMLLRVAQDRQLLQSLSSNAIKPKSIKQYVDELVAMYKAAIEKLELNNEMPDSRG